MNKVIFKGIDKEFDAIAIYKSQQYVQAAHEVIANLNRDVLEIQMLV